MYFTEGCYSVQGVHMAVITYYTKLGCQTAAKQVAVLRQAGHQVEIKDLLVHPWSADELTSYFGDLPVEAWFNPASPRVKSGEIDPAAYQASAALQLMLADHLLIRRPLMESGGTRSCGFDPAKVHAWVGLAEPEKEIGRSAEFATCSQPETPDKTQVCP
jgi:nitrogenase-associated protein